MLTSIRSNDKIDCFELENVNHLSNIETTVEIGVSYKSNDNANSKSIEELIVSNKSVDFRMGGIGRSRGRKSLFKIDKIRGLYDQLDIDNDNEESLSRESDIALSSNTSILVRRCGLIYFQSKIDMEIDDNNNNNNNNDEYNNNWICFVKDNETHELRACALRTVVEMISTLKSLGLLYIVVGFPFIGAYTQVYL